jgi:hypothetical protein
MVSLIHHCAWGLLVFENCFSWVCNSNLAYFELTKGKINVEENP